MVDLPDESNFRAQSWASRWQYNMEHLHISGTPWEGSAKLFWDFGCGGVHVI